MTHRYLGVLAAMLLPVAAQAEPAIPSAWVQLVAGGGAEVRATIGASQACPSLIADGIDIAMSARARADENFPDLCSVSIPVGSKTLVLQRIEQLGDLKPVVTRVPLPAPLADPKRILVLGDTGCRIKGTYIQACNDPVAWPFAGLARAAAALKPDLVIHLGDYLYRESPCPDGNAGCAGSPYGDNWASWDADFFSPAALLLQTAPWLIVRGNHEDCSRAGSGFLRLLGPIAFEPAAPCVDHLPPYALMVGSQAVALLDNASASDTSVDEKSVPIYQADFESLKAMANIGVGQELWLVAHRPIWAAISGPLGIPIGGNATMIAAAGDLSAFAAISLMLAGHIHTFEAINYDAKVPPQIVAGHGGDSLDVTPVNLHGAIFQGHSGVSVKDGVSVPGFGFLIMVRDATGSSWTIQLYDSAGLPQRTCAFAAGRVSCP